MGLMIYLIWLGGAFCSPQKTVGFWARVFWPVEVGSAIAEWAFDRDGYTP